MNKKMNEWEEANSSFDFNESFVYQQVKRSKRKNVLIHILKACVCTFVFIFVLANTSTHYIKATKDIPLLNGLNDLLNINNGVYVAIQEEYIQEINQTQRDGDLEVTVESIVVDDKSIYVFFKPYYNGKYMTEEYRNELLKDGGEDSVGIHNPQTDVPFNGILSYEILDEYHMLSYDIVSENIFQDVSLPYFGFEIGFMDDSVSFEIDIDNSKVAKKEVIETNQTMMIEGQKIEITKIEVYPLSLRIHLKQDEENTYWLKDLEFEIEMNGETYTEVKEWNYFDNYYAYSITSPYFVGNDYKITLKSVDLVKKGVIATFNTQTQEWNDPTGLTTFKQLIENDKTHPFEYTMRIMTNQKEASTYVPIQLNTFTQGMGASSYIDEKGNLVASISFSKEDLELFELLEFELYLGEKVEVNQRIK